MYEEMVKRLRNAANEKCFIGCFGICNHCEIGEALNQAADAIDELSKPKWIPVTERLPEPGWYLVRCNEVHKHVHRIAYYYDTVWYENSNDITEFVTHWIPLPEPPKEE